jgi:glycopeptide antibiotics resistance protein
MDDILLTAYNACLSLVILFPFFFLIQMESRQKQLAVLSKHIEEANDRINKVLGRLGWTREHVKQKYKV